MIITNSTTLQSIASQVFCFEAFAIENACDFLRREVSAKSITIPAKLKETGERISLEVVIEPGQGFYTRIADGEVS